jgi:branched-chain amino acid aminotransferase
VAVPELASVDGRITSRPEAVIPAADDGLLRGDGVFEVIRIYRGTPFALAEHLDRMGRSASAIDLPLDRGALEIEISALLDQFGTGDAQLRLVATRGGRRLAFTEALPPYATKERIAVISLTYAPSVMLNGVKSLSYAANMKAIRTAESRGADDAVLVRPDGVVLEAPTSTVFWASSEGRLRTPALEVGILASITRDRLVRELEVEEGEWRLEELEGATEAFLASTVREVQAIAAVNETELEECPGRRTREAAEAFSAILDRELAASASG